MSDKWLPVGRKPPFKCFRTHASDAQFGPFFEFEGSWVDGESFREETRYLSASFVREMLAAEGSPFVDPWAELQAERVRHSELAAEALSLSEEVMEARLRVQELETQLDVAKRAVFNKTVNSSYVDEVANLVASRIEARQREFFTFEPASVDKGKRRRVDVKADAGG